MKGMKEGSVMVIKDHLRLCKVNSMEDLVEDRRFGPRHLPATQLYSDRFSSLVKKAGEKIGAPVFEGTYCWTSGPSYETPAEVRAGMRKCRCVRHEHGSGGAGG